MLKIELTKNLSGMSVSGDYLDLDELRASIYFIVDSDFNETIGFSEICLMLLSLAYDIRHASTGDRTIEFIDNCADEDLLNELNENENEKMGGYNLYYSVNITMITCIYIALIIDPLCESNIRKYTKLKENGYCDTSKQIDSCKTALERAELRDAIKAKELRQFHKEIKMKRESIQEEPYKLMNQARYHINVLKNFQHKVWNALSKLLSNEDIDSLYEEYTLKVSNGYPYYKDTLNQFCEYLDMNYLNIKTKKERVSVLPQMISNLICLGPEYKKIVNLLSEEASKSNCSIDDLHYDNPEIKKW